MYICMLQPRVWLYMYMYIFMYSLEIFQKMYPGAVWVSFWGYFSGGQSVSAYSLPLVVKSYDKMVPGHRLGASWVLFFSRG